MSNRLETYRIQAYNTSKQSENKIHDDAVARRYGFSGGLVPGVDVMAYMMHLPVAKWGRAFLERGLVEARFVKPVYDGEIAEATADESNDTLSIQVHSRGRNEAGDRLKTRIGGFILHHHLFDLLGTGVFQVLFPARHSVAAAPAPHVFQHHVGHRTIPNDCR